MGTCLVADPQACCYCSVCGIRPVERIICCRAGSGGHWEAAFPGNKGEITQQLKLVLAGIQERPAESRYGHYW